MEPVKNTFSKTWSFIKKHSLASTVALSVAGYYLYNYLTSKTPELKISYFIQALQNNAVEKVTVHGDFAYFKPLGSEKWFFSNIAMLTKNQLFKLLFSNPALQVSSIGNKQKEQMALLGVGSVLYFYMIKQLLPSSDHKGQNPSITQQSQVKFQDIYGMARAKTELQEIVDFIQDPQQFKDIGLRLRKGVLLYGPPGTGKTLLAKALAGECGANFIYRSASEFLEVYVGVGPQRIRALFEEARAKSPCIVFIDEIDAIGHRAQNKIMGSSDSYEKNATINQLLVELDGFNETDRVVMIAATNHEKHLEKALIRSGRFDTKIRIDLPNKEERRGIMELKFNKYKIVSELSQEKMDQVVDRMQGFSGADIDAMVNEAKYGMVRANKMKLSDDVIEAAYDRIKEGLFDVNF